MLYLDDRPIATMFSLAHRGRYLSLLTGFDFEKFRNYSVGLLLNEDMIADCIACTLFDLTIGTEPYKRAFDTHPDVVWTLWNSATVKGHLAPSCSGAPPGYELR